MADITTVENIVTVINGNKGFSKEKHRYLLNQYIKYLCSFEHELSGNSTTNDIRANYICWLENN